MSQIFPSTIGTKPGLEIWRIEKLHPKPTDPKSYGSFQSGDAYIVLKTNEKAKNVYSYDVHFWLGSQCSQDEQGAAAYHTVTLDDQLGGKPVQHREVEGHESNLFLSYFPKGIQYLQGGIESGFRHVDPNAYQPRLFHCKGKRNVRCNQTELKASSLNEGDVFLLDCGLTIYQWNGREANKYEKFKGLEIATKIKDSERGGKAKLIFLESGENDEKEANFWKVLGGARRDVKSAKEGGDDDAIKNLPISLWRVSDSSGSLQITHVANSPLTKQMLDTNDAFIVDSGTEIFVWVGKGATKEEKSKCMQFGSEYLQQNQRPSWTPLTRIQERAETPAFKALFTLFDQEPMPQEEKAYVKPEAKLIVDALYQKRKDAEEKMAATNGNSKIWRVENLTPVLIDQSQNGQFYSGDSYIILYEYRQGSRDSHITYFWQGRDSSTDEKAASAMLAIDIDSKSPGEPTQVRVVQGKEPNHFLALFKGKFIVHAGGVASGFHNRAPEETAQDGPRLYQVKGSTALNTSASAVYPSAASLNSGDSFILVSGMDCIIWFGSGSNQDERQFAANIAQILGAGRTIHQVEEGSEPEEFWQILGGRTDYAQVKLADNLTEPRLFVCNGVTGNFILEEVFNFSQDDLQQDSVVILDAGNEVFVWIGHDARTEDKKNAMQVALNYVQNAPDGRSADTPVSAVTAGSEPFAFTSHFLGWSDKQATNFSDPYKEKLKSMAAAGNDDSKYVASSTTKSTTNSASVAPAFNRQDSKATSVTAATIASVGNEFSNPSQNPQSYASLTAGTPSGVDPKNKEFYLSDAEFETVFKMKRDAFAKLAAWKKAELKKNVKLF